MEILSVLSDFIKVSKQDKEYPRLMQEEKYLIENIVTDPKSNNWELSKKDILNNASPSFFTTILIKEQKQDLLRTPGFIDMAEDFKQDPQ